MEIIIAHLICDFGALKACSLTCRSLYTAAAPHLHHTLTLTGYTPEIRRCRLKPLPKLHALGLTHLVKALRLKQRFNGHWFMPQAFTSLDLRYFSALANVHTLKLQSLEIHRFIPGIERHFGHFSKTLRSITLYDPCCTPRQLSYFLSLFSNLDDIGIRNTHAHRLAQTIPDTELVPFSPLKSRGRMALYNFTWVETWTYLIASSGGLWFRHMDLRMSTSCASVLLGACGKTLESLRFGAMSGSASKQFLAAISAGLS